MVFILIVAITLITKKIELIFKFNKIKVVCTGQNVDELKIEEIQIKVHWKSFIPHGILMVVVRCFYMLKLFLYY